jgi:hypothetical protein
LILHGFQIHHCVVDGLVVGVKKNRWDWGWRILGTRWMKKGV